MLRFHPFPFRTGSLSSVKPMVLRTWESRSPPFFRSPSIEISRGSVVFFVWCVWGGGEDLRGWNGRKDQRDRRGWRDRNDAVGRIDRIDRRERKDRRDRNDAVGRIDRRGRKDRIDRRGRKDRRKRKGGVGGETGGGTPAFQVAGGLSPNNIRTKWTKLFFFGGFGRE